MIESKNAVKSLGDFSASQLAEYRALVQRGIARGWIQLPQTPDNTPSQPSRHNAKRVATNLV